MPGNMTCKCRRGSALCRMERRLSAPGCSERTEVLREVKRDDPRRTGLVLLWIEQRDGIWRQSLHRVHTSPALMRTFC